MSIELLIINIILIFAKSLILNLNWGSKYDATFYFNIISRITMENI